MANMTHLSNAIAALVAFLAMTTLFAYVEFSQSLIFRSFNTKLSTLTYLLLKISDIYFHWHVLAFCFLLTLAVPGAGLLIDANSRTQLPAKLYGRIVRWVVCLFLIGLVAWSIFGLVLPMRRLIEAVGGR